MDYWTHFLIAVAANLPALIAAVAAFMQAMSNASQNKANAARLDELHAKVSNDR